MKPMHEREGRALFGQNAPGYDSVRPAYPAWMTTLLAEQRALFPGAVTLEIGAGNGLATRQLMAFGAAPLTLLEPDERFAPLLRSIIGTAGSAAKVRSEPFEEAVLDSASFDLVVSATAFHWLNPETRVAKLSRIVKPGGHVALLWNVFQDVNRPDPFHEATNHLLARLDSSPSSTPDKVPFALDRQAREKEFLQDGFELLLYAESHWQLNLDPEQVGKLYEGFSSIARLPEARRYQILDELVHIANTTFAGLVTRNMTSPLYLFRRT